MLHFPASCLHSNIVMRVVSPIHKSLHRATFRIIWNNIDKKIRTRALGPGRTEHVPLTMCWQELSNFTHFDTPTSARPVRSIFAVVDGMQRYIGRVIPTKGPKIWAGRLRRRSFVRCISTFVPAAATRIQSGVVPSEAASPYDQPKRPFIA